MHLMMCVDL